MGWSLPRQTRIHLHKTLASITVARVRVTPSQLDSMSTHSWRGSNMMHYNNKSLHRGSIWTAIPRGMSSKGSYLRRCPQMHSTPILEHHTSATKSSKSNRIWCSLSSKRLTLWWVRLISFIRVIGPTRIPTSTKLWTEWPLRSKPNSSVTAD